MAVDATPQSLRALALAPTPFSRLRPFGRRPFGCGLSRPPHSSRRRRIGAMTGLLVSVSDHPLDVSSWYRPLPPQPRRRYSTIDHCRLCATTAGTAVDDEIALAAPLFPHVGRRQGRRAAR